MLLWTTAFLDLPADTHAAGLDFWRRVTGYDVSPARGEHDEFVTLEPGEGDAHLKVQRLAGGPARVHLDLHVTDPRTEAARAESLGARTVADQAEHGYAVMTSPGGLTFCLVSHPSARRTPPAVWPGGHTSLVDQVCLDVTPSGWDAECAFWAGLTGERLVESSVAPTFRSLTRRPDQPLRFLLQRLDDEQDAVTAHLDLAASDRAAETARHEELGATVLATHEHWTVLRDPAGSAYCVTDRDPETGLLV